MSKSTGSFRVGQQGVGVDGQLAHPQLLDHSQRLKENFYKVGEHAWCLVGNGLSNQTFVEGPELSLIHI